MLSEELDKRLEKAESSVAIAPMLIKGQINFIVAPPSSGKTIISYDMSRVASEKGYAVLYFDLDSPLSEFAAHRQYGKEHGFRVLDAKAFVTIRSLIDEGIMEGKNMSDLVIVFDTYKKFTDTMSKRASKTFLGKLRQLTMLGATILVIGHTNKHRQDGKLIEEGTNDVRSETDNLWILDDSGTPGALSVFTEKKSTFQEMPTSIVVKRHESDEYDIEVEWIFGEDTDREAKMKKSKREQMIEQKLNDYREICEWALEMAPIRQSEVKLAAETELPFGKIKVHRALAWGSENGIIKRVRIEGENALMIVSPDYKGDTYKAENREM